MTLVVLRMLIVLGLFVSSSVAQTTSFTYQGRLLEGTLAATGSYDFIFKLFDDPTDPTAPQIGGDQIRNDVAVNNGVFSVMLNFGNTAFEGGGDRFLEIHIRPGASTGPYARLEPRQQVTSSPFAMKALKSDLLSDACVMCVTDSQILALDGSKVTGTVSNAATAATATNVTGIVQIANGGTGSSTKNFVDLSTNQVVGGNKTFGHVTFDNPFAAIQITGGLNVGGIVTADQFHGGGDGLFGVPGTFKWQTSANQALQADPDNGYLVTNSSQVTVTLPTNIGVGQRVRVSGTGAGGWKIAQNDGQSVIGAGITLVPAAWTPRETNRNWSGLASSSNGFNLAATVSSPSGRIYTSDDGGITWTPRESNRDWRAVASSSDGSKLAAVAFFDPVFTSTDFGVTWTPRSVRGASSIASSGDGSKLVTGSPYSNFPDVYPGYIHTSADSGATWNTQNINRPWAGFASSADGTKLIASTATPSGGLLFRSTDSGATWTQLTVTGSFISVASSADGTKLVAVGDSTRIFVSSDSGATWTPRENVRLWTAVSSSADGTRLAAVADGGQIYLSIDSGSNWVAVESVRSWSAVAISGDGTRVVAAVWGGQIYTFDIPPNLGQTTTVGTAGYLVGPQFSSIELQYVGNGKFLPLSHSGTILGY